jgi:hypothetical protein
MSKNKQEENYLSQFVNGEDNSNNNNNYKPPRNNNNNNVDFDPSSLEFINVDINMLPLGMFYDSGTQIKIRAAKVHEIQKYSVVDNKNYIDVTEKMNAILASCVRYIFPDKKQGSYKDLRDGDRLFLIFMIRELTFQKGPSFAKDIQCEHCNHEFKIPFRATHNADYPKTFISYEMPEKLSKFFNPELCCFEFPYNDEIIRLAPPKIGIQELFFDNIKNKVIAKKDANISFLKIIPYLLYDKSYISEDGIIAKEKEFKNMNDYNKFIFLTQAVDNMIFGLKGLKMQCPECKEEVHSDMDFPGGASTIFIIPDIFNDFIKK